nr:MAG TPA: hypothetical protein [Caudoviricetes sp.]
MKQKKYIQKIKRALERARIYKLFNYHDRRKIK